MRQSVRKQAPRFRRTISFSTRSKVRSLSNLFRRRLFPCSKKTLVRDCREREAVQFSHNYCFPGHMSANFDWFRTGHTRPRLIRQLDGLFHKAQDIPGAIQGQPKKFTAREEGHSGAGERFRSELNWNCHLVLSNSLAFVTRSGSSNVTTADSTLQFSPFGRDQHTDGRGGRARSTRD